MDCFLTLKTTTEKLEEIDRAWKAKAGYKNRSVFVRDAIDNFMKIKN